MWAFAVDANSQFCSFNVFNYYSAELKTSKYLLLKKNSADNFSGVENEEIKTTQWNKWIEIDARDSVQPNIAIEMGLQLQNASNFKKYYSIPFHLNTYTSFKSMGILWK